MRTKNVAIIGVIALIAIVAVCGSYFLFFNHVEYKNITMNGVTMEVPKSDDNVTQNTSLYSRYNDTKNHINAFVYDSTNAGINDLDEAMEFAALREMFQLNATPETNDGITYNYSKSTGVYSYVTNFTHKNVLVVTKDKENMIHIVKTLKVNEEAVNQTNNTNQTTTKASSTTKKKTNTATKKVEREEDKITADGWNPKEHEVSREKLDSNLERVYYDDGYSRVVDKKGNIKSYGY
ncbi:MAG: hypothetical protein IJJ47_11660 [Methanosphaera sp.]|nr:hypothetical protein [Methanosphaera sp.]